VNFLEVIGAQRTVLATELAAQLLVTNVNLIKSIGGTWTTDHVAQQPEINHLMKLYAATEQHGNGTDRPRAQ